LLKRISQFVQLLLGKTFSSEELIIANTVSRYSEKSEINQYSDISDIGLYPFENEGLKESLSLINSTHNCLIIGCGAGREAFELTNYFDEVWAVDNNQHMINKAKEINTNNHIHFMTNEKLDHSHKFDFIFCNAYLSSNIPGKKQRQEFFKTYLKLLNKSGLFLYFPDIFEIKSTPRYLIASYILRFKFLLSQSLEWEYGDTIRNYLGEHTRGYFPIYYHYYQSVDDFKRTLPKEYKVTLQRDDKFIILKKRRDIK